MWIRSNMGAMARRLPSYLKNREGQYLTVKRSLLQGAVYVRLVEMTRAGLLVGKSNEETREAEKYGVESNENL